MRKPGAFGRPGFSETDDLANVDWQSDDTRDAGAEQGGRAPIPSATSALRPYQLDVIERVNDEIAAGRRRILLVAPTGAGKTVIAAEIIRRAWRGVDRRVRRGGAR